MKKQILTLTMCLALTATAALAGSTNQVPQKANATLKTQAKATVMTKNTDTIKPPSREDAKKCFEEKRMNARENMYKELGLSDEQKAKAEALDLKAKTEAEPLFKKVQAEAKKLRELKIQKASIFKIWKQQKVFKAAKNNLKKHMIASKKAFEAILTQEQKSKLNSLKLAKKKEMAKFKDYHKHGYPPCKVPRKHHPEFMGPPPEDMGPNCPQGHGPMPFPPKDVK